MSAIPGDSHPEQERDYSNKLRRSWRWLLLRYLWIHAGNLRRWITEEMIRLSREASEKDVGTKLK